LTLILYLEKKGSEAWRILNKLVRELDDREIPKYAEIICECINKYMQYENDFQNGQVTKNQEYFEKINIKEMQELFVRYLQALCTIAKIAYSVG
jgi:hypothetical protein